MGMQYNYVFFNTIDSYDKVENRRGYYSICLRDLEKLSNVKIVTYPLDYAGWLKRSLFFLCNSNRVNRIIRVPFKRKWYPYYWKNSFKDEKPLCFVVLNRFWFTPDYLQYLKLTYPDAKFVLLFRDLVKVAEEANKALVGSNLFDLIMTIDQHEAEMYGMVHYDEYESKIDVPIDPHYPISDVFFAGKAKDRLGKLMTAYRIFRNAGLRVDYYLTGVPEEQRVQEEGIVYADKQMSYSEMLRRTVNTRCILEFNQDGALGYTSRFLEAVMYNKKLITDNTSIKSTRFYKTGYIQCVDKASDIDPKFIFDEIVDYNYDGEYSPLRLIEQIDTKLQEKR